MIRLVVSRGLAAIVIAASIVIGAGQALASDKAEHFVHLVAGKVLKAANAGSSGQFRTILRQHADLPAISKIAAGRHGRSMSKAERAMVQQAVELMIAQGFAKNSSWLRGDSIKVTGSSESARTVQVTTKIVGGSVDEVKWKLAKRGTGFRVIDINVAGLWLSSQMRAKLSSKLKNARGDVIAALAN